MFRCKWAFSCNKVTNIYGSAAAIFIGVWIPECGAHIALWYTQFIVCGDVSYWGWHHDKTVKIAPLYVTKFYGARVVALPFWQFYTRNFWNFVVADIEKIHLFQLLIHSSYVSFIVGVYRMSHPLCISKDTTKSNSQQ